MLTSVEGVSDLRISAVNRVRDEGQGAELKPLE
jgi:hypothetical protein